jgi:hypothetical protein
VFTGVRKGGKIAIPPQRKHVPKAGKDPRLEALLADKNKILNILSFPSFTALDQLNSTV